ncbi:transglycosylase SLT domain protein [[Clostridium] bifermentans ATCC 638]|uniref:Transglycosylase SLT domain protein n=1 Tax=Paraclostridium bifermentans ATCC 638 = DSM 14991 TaxID=1233171 RepID=T4VRB9_PARBF|nr:lytic transglycosylase domain-containing protein [Paraclostridium bifermentans]EQK43645.1 transglycosylase SLT domain protein [[Clostridium] bifermentans ATCC 638] [Paraclostridium bifermentans ATCC 638 = DSM 14991]RIZ59650.1 transglycosylase [Paraclostridium bifermentans]UAG17488.1 lytic transglycosylase domain-containing protein [Paraclostridium bifermentans]
MIDNIDLLKMTALMSNNNSYKTYSNTESGQAFDMLILGLLKAVANTPQGRTNQYVNNCCTCCNHNNNNIQTSNNKTENLDTVNSMHNSNKLTSTSKNKDVNAQIENAIAISSKKYGVDENLIRSIIKVESDFNPKCTSKAGAKGLMQLMPENCRDLGVKNPYDIYENIDGGTRHIKEYLDKYNGDTKMALMAYNGGPTRMRKRGVNSPEDIYLMPKETQNYVPKVMKYYKG